MKDGPQKEEDHETLVLVLQPRVRGREDFAAASEGQALQVSHLLQEAVHGARPADSLYAGAQGEYREGAQLNKGKGQYHAGDLRHGEYTRGGSR
jgi:hypothetical protein